MKFLHTRLRELHEFPDSHTPKFAVLSHTSPSQDGKNPVNRSCAEPGLLSLQISNAIESACEEAQRRDIDYLWVHPLCIDKSSSAEIEEAVNGAFRRLEGASVCLAFLHDLPSDRTGYDVETWKRCVYWTRAWTLQQLIIPPRVEFFDADWNHRGSKSSPEMLVLLKTITGIPRSVLRKRAELWNLSLATRISWASERRSSREEDVAYSLAAITAVTMSVRYGEGATKAFLRLQEAILQDTRDGSLLAWCSDDGRQIRGLLARAPSEFCSFVNVNAKNKQSNWVFDGLIKPSSRGLEVQSRMAKHSAYTLMEVGRRGGDTWTSERVGIWLQEIDGMFYRVDPATVVRISGMGVSNNIHMARDTSTPESVRTTTHLDTEGDNATTSDPDPPRSDTDIQNPPETEERPSPGVSSDHSSSGTKRDRHGQSKISDEVPLRAKASEGHRAVPTIDGGLEASSTSFQSNEDAELGSDARLLNAQPCSQDVNGSLLPENEFQDLQTELSHLCYGLMAAWLQSSRSTMPGRKEPPRKKAKAGHINDEQDDGSPEPSGMPADLHTRWSLGCPFYLTNPTLHRQCLIQQDFKSIKDVRKHVKKHHAQPPYCPTCRSTFVSTADRDKHVTKRSCELQNQSGIEGIDIAQSEEMKRRDDASLSEEERWFILFSIVFPGFNLGRSPYLTNGIEPRVSRVRDYWCNSGSDFVSAHLDERELFCKDRSDKEQLISALKRLTFEYLIDQAINNDDMFNQ